MIIFDIKNSCYRLIFHEVYMRMQIEISKLYSFELRLGCKQENLFFSTSQALCGCFANFFHEFTNQTIVIHSLFTLTFHSSPRFYFAILLFPFCIIILIKKDRDRLYQFSRHSSNYEIFFKVVSKLYFFLMNVSILYFCCFEKLDYTSPYPIIVNVYYEFDLFQNKNFPLRSFTHIYLKLNFYLISVNVETLEAQVNNVSFSIKEANTPQNRHSVTLHCGHVTQGAIHAIDTIQIKWMIMEDLESISRVSSNLMQRQPLTI